MRHMITIIVFIGLILAASPGLTQDDYGMLQSAMERTQEVIERARDVVGQSSSERAKSLLEAAIRLQSRAGYLLDDSRFGNMTEMIQAGKYTNSARQKAMRAIAIARQATENEEYIRRRLERTDDLIRRTEEKIGPKAPENIQRLFETAQQKQQRAIELFRNRRFKMSLQMTMQVEKSLEQMREETGGYVKARQHYESMQERYYTLLDRIEMAQMSENNQYRRQIEQAERLRKEAEGFAAEQGFARAERAMQNALEPLLRLSEELKEPGRVQAALGNLKLQGQTLQEKLAAISDRDADRLYRNAVQHLEKAEALYREGQYEAAATHLQATRQIFNRINKLLQNKG